MSRPNLFTLDTWGRHVGLVLEVFECALEVLEAESALPEGEDPLNRKLLFRARSENYRLTKEGRGCTSNIYYESANQPVENDEDRAAREWKRPDFICGLVDAQAGLDLFFVLECKRLGKRSSGGTSFNKLYTEKGVQRFMDPEWGYGKGTVSGAMIGYLQSMSSGKILKQVNGYAKKTKVPAIKREGDEWVDQGVTRLTQTLDRKVVPSPFSLGHLWIDLRRHYRDSE